MRQRISRTLLLCCPCLWALGGLAACGEQDEPLSIAAPSRSLFEESAYPVLLRDCSTPACHGNSERMFHIVGPGRIRLDPETSPIAPVTRAELDYSYDRARSMLKSASPQASRLLLKPLSEAEGGGSHGGTDLFGRDVYTRRTDEGLRVLSAWVRSAADERPDGGAQ